MLFFRRMRRELEMRLSGAKSIECAAKREREIWENRNRNLDYKEIILQLRADDLDKREQELIKERRKLEGMYPELLRKSG